MKRIFTIIFGCIAYMSSANAQEINEIIASMPNNIIVKLDQTQKDLLISNPEDTTQLTVALGAYGELKRLAISNDFISLKTSEGGNTQIKLLPLINDSKIICVVKTVCGQEVCDSQIQFYTTKWIPIKGTTLFPDRNINWYVKEGVDRNSQDFKNAFASVDMDPMKMTLSANDLTLTVDFTIKAYLSEEDYKKVQPYLTEKPKVFLWDKISFK